METEYCSCMAELDQDEKVVGQCMECVLDSIELDVLRTAVADKEGE